MAHRILVVDDDPHIRDVICFALQKAGHSVSAAKDGAEAVHAFARTAPDLIILDIGLPEFDGLEVCRRIRKTSDVPILFLSARDEEIDRIVGLELGADDYVTKPFSPRELVARVHVILKRVLSPQPRAASKGILVHGDIRLDGEAHLVTFGGVGLTLTGLEFAILQTLLQRPTMVFSREQILSSAYPDAVHVADRTIDSHIRNLRAKFLDLGCSDAIATVHGVGFRMGRCVMSDGHERI